MTKRSTVKVDGLSLRAYARHRKVSAPAVLKAVRTGRLKECLVTDSKGGARIADVELADIEWELNTDPSKAPGVTSAAGPRRARGGQSPLAEASTREKDARARLAELEFKRKSGELVNAKEMEDRVIAVFAHCRTKLLGLPRKAKALLPHLSAADVIAIDGLVREALEELATTKPARHGAAA